ncbi:hypothetical protein [Spirosoma endophyticum]|uniref:Uncharacterized protein n=1 Tax=Spirosoma endophyticum TaxID=662367 RepID=A0A1I2FAN3_9BACT|nr:hypothetical protein [Spirosoma endophyticum]SFF01818.1 hypothetical protein SAMN05216167_1257 [Spirosoma endophyticum]
MPIQNVDRDNTRGERVFNKVFPNQAIAPWLYDTCYFLELKEVRQENDKEIEETVELNRIIGVTDGGYDPSKYTHPWSVNWLDWFWAMAEGKSKNHLKDPFAKLYEAIAEQNQPGSGNFFLYRVSLSGQNFYFIGEGHHRITFLRACWGFEKS